MTKGVEILFFDVKNKINILEMKKTISNLEDRFEEIISNLKKLSSPDLLALIKNIQEFSISVIDNSIECEYRTDTGVFQNNIYYFVTQYVTIDEYKWKIEIMKGGITQKIIYDLNLDLIEEFKNEIRKE